MLDAERKERKRVQNRRNQRARRLRESERIGALKGQKQPYRVHRWRLENEGTGWAQALSSPIANPCEHSLSGVQSRKSPRQEDLVDSDTVDNVPSPTIVHNTAARNSPTADHLLHLINYNVFRALFRNKQILSQMSISLSLDHKSPHPKIISDADFPGYGVTLPATSNLPDSLTPTSTQKNVPHSTWISVLPFPRMRENLIIGEPCFSHADLVHDLIGDLVDNKKYALNQTQTEATTRLEVPPETDDEITTARNGLIVWGEPHRVESWEATPGFLRKWAWVVEGCDELIRSSNWWRMIRGEEPMQFLA